MIWPTRALGLLLYFAAGPIFIFAAQAIILQGVILYFAGYSNLSGWLIALGSGCITPWVAKLGLDMFCD